MKRLCILMMGKSLGDYSTTKVKSNQQKLDRSMYKNKKHVGNDSIHDTATIS